MKTTEHVRTWWHQHNGWLALVVLLLGAVGFGYGLGVYQRQSELASAYNQAINAKDKLINQLAGSAVRATGQAADAAATAANAADTASDAVMKAQKAADAAQDKGDKR